MDSIDWIVSAAVPAAIAALAGALSVLLVVRSVEEESSSTAKTGLRFSLAPIVLSLGWAAAVTAGLMGQRLSDDETALAWWPEEFWQQGYWAIWAVAIVMGATAQAKWRDLPLRWVVAGLLAVGTAAISLPSGEGWDDMLPLHQGWMALLASACLLGVWSLDRLSVAKSDLWFPLVVLATLAGPMAVGASTYGALAQWTLAAIFATLPIVLLALLGWIDSRSAVGIAYPGMAFTTVVMAAGRFYNYEDHPWWSYLGMLLVPTAVLIVDHPLRSRHSAIRAAIAALVAVALLGACAWLQYTPADPEKEEWSLAPSASTANVSTAQ
jgi:hypothetical protein